MCSVGAPGRLIWWCLVVLSWVLVGLAVMTRRLFWLVLHIVMLVSLRSCSLWWWIL